MLIRTRWLRVHPIVIQFFSLHGYSFIVCVCVCDHNITYFIIYVTIFLSFHTSIFFTIARVLKIKLMVMSYVLPLVKRLPYFIYIRSKAEQMTGECPMARVVRVAQWLQVIWTLMLNVYKPRSRRRYQFAIFSMGVTGGSFFYIAIIYICRKKMFWWGGRQRRKVDETRELL